MAEVTGTLEFREKDLVENLELLTSDQRLAFGVACAQRLVSALHSLDLETRGNTLHVLQSALDEIWESILKPADRNQIRKMLSEVMRHIPDNESKAWSVESAYLEDAVSAVAYCLRFILSSDARELAWAARCVVDAIDQFLTRDCEPLAGQCVDEAAIARHPALQHELSRQGLELELLRTSATSLTQQSLLLLRQRSSSDPMLVLR